MVHFSLKPGIGFAITLAGACGVLVLAFLPSGWITGSRLTGIQQASGRAGHFRTSSSQSPGDCGPEAYPSVLFEEHVESGSPGWTHGGLSDQWEISSWLSHDGNYAWNAPAPAFISDQSLLSPPIALPSNESPLTLHFWQYQDIEYSVAGCHDGALLEISTDDGQSWMQVNSQLLANSYNGIVEEGGDNPLAGRPAWCGKSSDWFESIVALDEFAGQTVRFRFRLGTNSTQGREGWYLDALTVQSCPSAYIASLSPESRQSGLPGDTILHLFRLENLGIDDRYTFQLEAGSWPNALITPVDVALPSGEVFTASVLVDLPAGPGGQQMEDSFRLKAISVGNPDLILQSVGISSLDISPGIGVSSDQSLLAGEPGETIAHTFSLTNTGDITDNFYIEAGGVDWPTSVSPNSGLLGPGENKSIPVRVTVPIGPLKTTGAVITDTFQLIVSSGWNSLIWGEAGSTTRASLNAGLWIEGPASVDVKSGRPIPVQFYITNLGNFTDRYTLEWLGDWLVGTPVEQTDWLAPGQRGELTITIQSPPRTPDGEISEIALKAVSQLDPSKKGQLHSVIYNRNRLYFPLIRQ